MRERVLKTGDVRWTNTSGEPVVGRLEVWIDQDSLTARPLADWIEQEGWTYVRGCAPLSLEPLRHLDPATPTDIYHLSMAEALYDQHHAAGADPFDTVRA